VGGQAALTAPYRPATPVTSSIALSTSAGRVALGRRRRIRTRRWVWSSWAWLGLRPPVARSGAWSRFGARRHAGGVCDLHVSRLGFPPSPCRSLTLTPARLSLLHTPPSPCLSSSSFIYSRLPKLNCFILYESEEERGAEQRHGLL
jgi:hypothetical protein